LSFLPLAQGKTIGFMETTSDTDIADILVRVWGMAGGHAFFQNVYARHLTSSGAMLANVEHPLEPEDVIGVQYADKKARFRVLRVSDGGLPQRIYAEIQLLEGQQCPWEQHLDAGKSVSSPGSNKRQFPRLKVRFPLELRPERGSAAMQTNSADISGRGCYIETLVPSPLGTNFTIIFWIDDEKITTTGVVRSSDPGVGMGIEFTGLDEELKERLQKRLAKMTGQSALAEGAT
jgi:hypothetical protein